MLTGPKQIKFKKIRKGKLSKFEYKANYLKFGIIGLKALESGFINARQIEAARQTIIRKTKRKGKMWTRIFPYVPITSKPIGARMGKGKGPISHWSAKIGGGNVLFELCGVNIIAAANALKAGSAKLPVKTKIFI